MPNSSYIKFYWLEREYFPEIHDFFHKEHYLTPEQFFSIIFWKSIRSRKKIKEGLSMKGQSLDIAIKNLTEEFFKADNKGEKLNILLRRRGFKLAMASAVLTVLYPDDFTVYDVRVREQLKYSDITYDKSRVQKYFKEYLEQVLKMGRKIAQNPTLSLRDCDRILWAKSWYEDLQKFLLI